MRRAIGLWLLLAVAYAATLGLPATPAERYTPAEAHRLLTADSIVHDGDLDLTDQYRGRAWRSYYHGTLRPTAEPRNGRLIEAQGIGFPALLAPAYAIGGAIGAEVLCALLMALAFVLAAALARRIVPEPWATRATLAVALSPPAVTASTAVSPTAACAAMLAGAALLALRARERPWLGFAVGSATLVALLPWLSVRAFVPAAVVALALARWMRRRNRGLSGFVALEIVLTSAVVYITINDRLFGGLVPSEARLASGPATGAGKPDDYLARGPRLVGALLDRDVGLLRWAPILALVFGGVWLLWRSRRDRLASVVSDQVDVEATAGLLAVVGLAGLLAGAFVEPSLHGNFLAVPDLELVLPCVAPLVAWGLRRAARTGAALTALTLAGSVWLVAGARLDDGTGLAPPRGALPWGGAEDVLPRFGDGGAGEVAMLVLVALALLVLAGRELRARRRWQALE